MTLLFPPLSVSPVPLKRLWVEHVNQPPYEAEVQAIAESIRRGRPYGGEEWQSKVARQLRLEHTFRDRGRPRLEELKGTALVHRLDQYRGGRPAEDDSTFLVLHHNASNPGRLSLRQKLDVYAKVFHLKDV